MIPHSKPWISPSEESSALERIRLGALSKSEKTILFQKALAQYLQKDFSITTGNGTQALYLILNYLKIGAGDEVILPSYVCDKVYFGIQQTGAQPVLCDTGPNWVMTFESVQDKITTKTKAIVLVHIFGINAWSNKFTEFNIPIIEDICQSFGHNELAYRTGTYTQFAFGSFHGTKPFYTGEGGFLAVNDESAYQKILEIKHKSGLISEMTDVQSAMGLSLLNRYGDILKRRKFIANYYFNHIQFVSTQPLKLTAESNMFFRFPLLSNLDFKSAAQDFIDKGVHIRKGVDALIHRMIGLSDSLFPNTVNCFNCTISIPILPQMNIEEMDIVVDAANEILN